MNRKPQDREVDACNPFKVPVLGVLPDRLVYLLDVFNGADRQLLPETVIFSRVFLIFEKAPHFFQKILWRVGIPHIEELQCCYTVVSATAHAFWVNAR